MPRFRLTLLFCALAVAGCASVEAPIPRADLVITNARILDGTGNSWYRGAIAIRGGRIAAIGPAVTTPAARTIDARDHIVAPGFIDVHAHIELGINDRPTADNYLQDGVTTVVTGNCGGSDDDLRAFLARIDAGGASMNVASLIGHNTVRRQAMGLANRRAGPEDIAKMTALVDKGMTDGAVGFSTGLIYLPGMYSDTAEVKALAGAAASRGGLYASHMRNEGSKVAEAIEETLDIGRTHRMPVQISHFKVSGNANWGRSKETLAMIVAARDRGLDVTIDQYPYTASSTQLSALMPDALLEGGAGAARQRLADPDVRRQAVAEILQSARNSRRPSFAYAVVANHAADASLNGRNISQINLARGRAATLADEAETVVDLFLAGNAQMVFHGMDEADVRAIMAYPFNMIAADGGVQNGRGIPHPRSYGTNARVLGKYVREEKVLSLEDAVRRMTSLPAQKFGFRDRGLLHEGYAADLVIFDPASVADRATFADPHQYPAGIETVIVNGTVVIDGGQHTGARPGRALRGPAYKP